MIKRHDIAVHIILYILVCLLPAQVSACEGYRPESISELSVPRKIISAPQILLAAAALNVSTSTKELVADLSLIITGVLLVITLLYLVAMMCKRGKPKILFCLVFSTYLCSNFLTFHTDAGSYFCNGKPTISEVLNLLLTRS
jgi:hypothetical protein